MQSALLLLSCVLCSAGASVLLKMGVQGRSPSILAAAADPRILGGAALYVGSFLAYIVLLRRMPLSLVQPVVTAGVSAVSAIVAVAYFGETLIAANWLGLGLVCAGLVLLFQGRT